MYYVNLGNLGICTPDKGNPTSCATQTGWGLANTAPFVNLQANDYWSGSVYAPGPAGGAWYFGTYGGFQFTGVGPWALRRLRPFRGCRGR